MSRRLQHLRRLDRWALPLAGIGLATVAAYNWRLWQKDKVRLAELKALPPPLPLASWSQLPLVSVLVAAWNEAAYIEGHIESFLSLRYPHKELILCAGGTDETYALAQRYVSQIVKVLAQQPGEGKQRALARAFPETEGEIIFLTDADCLLDDGAFESTLFPVTEGTEQVCTGGSRPLDEQLDDPFVVAQAFNQLYSSVHTPTYVEGLLGRNCAVARTVLEQSKGLLAEAPTGTDYVLAKHLLKTGAKIRFLASSQVHTSYPTTVTDYISQQSRWLKNLLLRGHEYRDWIHVKHALLTSFMGLTMLLTPFMSFIFGRLGALLTLLIWSVPLLSRLRYGRLGVQLWPTSTPTRLYDLVRVMVADFVAWSRVLVIDIWNVKGTIRW